MKEKNKIKQQDTFSIIYISHKGNIYEFLIDNDDVEKVKKYRWCINQGRNDNRYIYAVARVARSNGKYIRLHRLITNCPSDKVVDHISHNTLDNRKQNLRVCSQAENKANRFPTCFNKSNFIGVYRDKCYWRAIFRSKRLGSFKDINDAIRARVQAETDFFNQIKQAPETIFRA